MTVWPVHSVVCFSRKIFLHQAHWLVHLFCYASVSLTFQVCDQCLNCTNQPVLFWSLYTEKILNEISLFKHFVSIKPYQRTQWSRLENVFLPLPIHKLQVESTTAFTLFQPNATFLDKNWIWVYSWFLLALSAGQNNGSLKLVLYLLTKWCLPRNSCPQLGCPTILKELGFSLFTCLTEAYMYMHMQTFY